MFVLFLDCARDAKTDPRLAHMYLQLKSCFKTHVIRFTLIVATK